jgi:hypothetical protein
VTASRQNPQQKSDVPNRETGLGNGRHLLRFQILRTTEYISFIQSVVTEIEVNVTELNITDLFHFPQFVFWITNKIYGTFFRNRLNFQ